MVKLVSNTFKLIETEEKLQSVYEDVFLGDGRDVPDGLLGAYRVYKENGKVLLIKDMPNA